MVDDLGRRLRENAVEVSLSSSSKDKHFIGKLQVYEELPQRTCSPPILREGVLLLEGGDSDQHLQSLEEGAKDTLWGAFGSCGLPLHIPV